MITFGMNGFITKMDSDPSDAYSNPGNINQRNLVSGFGLNWIQDPVIIVNFSERKR